MLGDESLSSLAVSVLVLPCFNEPLSNTLLHPPFPSDANWRNPLAESREFRESISACYTMRVTIDMLGGPAPEASEPEALSHQNLRKVPLASDEREETMLEKFDFIKGHMGGNEIVILYGDQIAEERWVNVAVSVLDPPNIGGDEVGIFSKSSVHNHLSVRIVGRSSRRFISMCGGLTQVLGRALIDTDFAARFSIEISEPLTEIVLETEAGSVPLKIETSNGEFKRAWTNMKAFISECYEFGVLPIKVAGVDAMKVGKFLVVNAADIKKKHPDVDFKKMDTSSLRTLQEIQNSFGEQQHSEQRSMDFALYDQYPEHGGNARVVFPHNIAGGHIEPSCGTGSVAIGIAMVQSDELEDGVRDIFFESGGQPVIGGPDFTQLRITTKNGKAVDADLSHSLVEILATGRCFTRL